MYARKIISEVQKMARKGLPANGADAILAAMSKANADMIKAKKAKKK